MRLKRAEEMIFLPLVVAFILASCFGIGSCQEEEAAKKLREIRERLKAEELSSKVNSDDLAKMTDLILPQKKKLDTSWVRNLFLPLLQQQKGMEIDLEGKGESEKHLELKGIVMVGKTAYALIDDEIVGENEFIDGMKVEKIEMGKVILKKDKQEKVLYLD